MSGLTARDLADLAYQIGLIIDDAHAADTTPERRDGLLAEAERLFDALDLAAPDKLDALRAVSVRLASEATMLREEERRYAARRSSLERGAERCRERAGELLRAMRELDPDLGTVRTAAGSYWLAATTSIVGPPDPADWPEEWRRVVTTVSADKAAAAKAHREGAVLPPGIEARVTESVRWK